MEIFTAHSFFYVTSEQDQEDLQLFGVQHDACGVDSHTKAATYNKEHTSV